MSIIPLISIIMPAYNAEKYINSAINSVQNQTFTDWELIIIDDSSNDRTEEIIKSYNNNKIRYIRISHLGKPSAVRNIGIKNALGTYISFLDSDDEYFNNALELLVNGIKEDDNNMCFGFASFMNEQAEDIPRLNNKVKDKIADLKQVNWDNLINQEFMTFSPQIIVKRDVLSQIGGYDENILYGEDFVLYVKLMILNLKKIKIIPEYIFKYRIYDDSLTGNTEKALESFNSWLSVIDWFFEQEIFLNYNNVKDLKSKFYTIRVIQWIRKFLKTGNKKIATDIIKIGLQSKIIKIKDKIKILPFYILSLIPFRILKDFASLYFDFKNRIASF